MDVKEHFKMEKQKLLNKELAYTLLACGDKEDVQALLDAGARLDGIMVAAEFQRPQYVIEFILGARNIENFARHQAADDCRDIRLKWEALLGQIAEMDGIFSDKNGTIRGSKFQEYETLEALRESQEYQALEAEYVKVGTELHNKSKAIDEKVLADFNTYISKALPLLLKENISQDALDKGLVSAYARHVDLLVAKKPTWDNTAHNIKLLLDAGADVNTKTSYGKYIIEYVSGTDPEILKLFIEKGGISDEAAKAAGIILPIKEAIRDVVDSNLDGHDHPLNKGMEEHNKFDGCHEGA